jgi:hypothetical protein
MTRMPERSELLHLFELNETTGTLLWKNPRARNKKPGDKAGCVVIMGRNRYIVVNIRKRLYLAHRIVWVMYFGNLGDDQLIDHRNRDGEDNRPSNLRLADHRLNALNSRQRLDNSSGVPGVTYDRNRRKWMASIMIKGKRHYLGRFESLEDAAAARRNAET